MKVLSAVTAALAATQLAQGQSSAPCKNVTGTARPLFGMPFFGPGIISGQAPLQAPAPAEPEERDVSGYSQLKTRWNKCLDVRDGRFQGGNTPQLWDCNANSGNQQWKVAGNAIRTTGNMCLDVPWGWVYPGATLQLWSCAANNQNQWFEVAGYSLRKKNTNFCVDVRDGNYNNGGSLQLFSCDWNWAGGNQMVSFNPPAPPAAQGSPSAFLGYAAVSIERFTQLHPECAPWIDHFRNAAAATGLHPTLVAAVAENESTCRERPNNGFGIMQFMDENAFRAYGGGDKQKASDAIWAGARYLRSLLDQSGQNLDAALRNYNGPVAQGGDPNYQRNIRTWMSGGSTW